MSLLIEVSFEREFSHLETLSLEVPLFEGSLSHLRVLLFERFLNFGFSYLGVLLLGASLT